uniref:Uncharacterized protein n=1 Tax=Avena sativa TaxID=4498 RepID=A0ACD5TDH9_AVESA
MYRPSPSSSFSMDHPSSSSSSSSSMDSPSSSSSFSMDCPSSSSSRVGAAAKTAAPGKFWAGTPPYAANARATGTSDFESIQDVESGTEFLGNSRIPGPLEALADKKIRVKRATTLPRASNGAGRNTTSRFMRPGPRDFAKDNDAAAGSSSSSAQAQHDFVSTARRALLAEAGSEFNFAGTDEWHDNSWYDDDEEEEEEPEQVEVDVQGLAESLQSCRLKSDPGCNPSAAAAEAHEFSLQDFCERWGVAPSDMHPDEPATSTRVSPLADHEVPTFYCGMCMDTLPVFDLFHGLPCAHTFCAPCMATCLQSRVGASELPITCP